MQPLPAWGDVERVLGVDWGVHTLITATAVAADDVDGKSQQVGRPFFLDTGGFDGRQARTRRQIDQLQNKVRRYEQERDALPEDHSKQSLVCGAASRHSSTRRAAAGASIMPATAPWPIWRAM